MTFAPFENGKPRSHEVRRTQRSHPLRERAFLEALLFDRTLSANAARWPCSLESMSQVITCPSELRGRVRVMRVREEREERVLTDRALAKNGGQVEALLAACWKETLEVFPYAFEMGRFGRWCPSFARSLARAWPTKFVAGEWDNGSDENLVESVTLTFDFFELLP